MARRIRSMLQSVLVVVAACWACGVVAMLADIGDSADRLAVEVAELRAEVTGIAGQVERQLRAAEWSDQATASGDASGDGAQARLARTAARPVR